MVSKPLPMLPAMSLPASWRQVLDPLRPVFARSWTFTLFVVLATGLVARTSAAAWRVEPHRPSPGDKTHLARCEPVVRLRHRQCSMA